MGTRTKLPRQRCFVSVLGEDEEDGTTLKEAGRGRRNDLLPSLSPRSISHVTQHNCYQMRCDLSPRDMSHATFDLWTLLTGSRHDSVRVMMDRRPTWRHLTLPFIRNTWHSRCRQTTSLRRRLVYHINRKSLCRDLGLTNFRDSP